MARSKRPPKTPERDVKAMFKEQEGRCSSCRAEIHLEKPRDFIIEHENQWAVSKNDALSNKTLRCIPCAKLKSYGRKHNRAGSDAHARAKIRHILGLNKERPSRGIPSRPFFKPKGKKKWRKRMSTRSGRFKKGRKLASTRWSRRRR